MVDLVLSTALNRSMKSLLMLAVILLIRKVLNIKSIRWANITLWIIFFVYLLFPRSILITVEDFRKYKWIGGILQSISAINAYMWGIEKEIGNVLSPINQLTIAGVILVYVAVQILKRNKILRESVIIESREDCKKYLQLFNLKRKVDIFINDKISSPITYGIFCPKIILQSYIFDDEVLLKYVLIHELTHIKKFDIVFTHIKNLIMCINWYNPFILAAAKYIEDDIEMLCDKLVIKKVGDTRDHRKDYCMAMLKLTERNENSRFVLKLHPTEERIIVMKKWRRTVYGVVALVVVVVVSMTSFIDVRAVEKDRVEYSTGIGYTPVNVDDKVEDITEKFSGKQIGKQPRVKPFIADINKKETLDGLSHKSYSFDMSSWTSANNDGLLVKLSNTSSKGGVKYEIIITENGSVIYQNKYDKDCILKIKTRHDSSYEVIIDNNSLNSMKYNIKIQSYIR